MTQPQRPHLILPAADTARRIPGARNALRIEEITPAARCSLRPKDEQARWLVEHRPAHLAFFWSSFWPCVGEACQSCSLPENSKGGAA